MYIYILKIYVSQHFTRPPNGKRNVNLLVRFFGSIASSIQSLHGIIVKLPHIKTFEYIQRFTYILPQKIIMINGNIQYIE